MKLFGVVASALLLVAGLGAPAGAEAEWYPPATDVPETGPEITTSLRALGTNSAGDVTALLAARPRYGATYYQAAQKPAGGSWSDPVDIYSDLTDTSGSDVAVDPRGNATIVLADGPRIIAFDKPRGGEWTRPVDLEPSHGSGATDLPQIVVDPQGNQTVVWRFNNGTRVDPDPQFRTVSRRFGQDWGRPQAFPTSEGGVSYLQLKVDGAGTVIALWSQHGNALTARRPLGHAWSKPFVLAHGSKDHPVHAAQLAVNARGDAVAIVNRETKRFNYKVLHKAESAYRPANGRWQPLRTVATGTWGVWQLVIDGQGRSTALHMRRRHLINEWSTSTSASGRAWSKPIPVLTGKSVSVRDMALGSNGIVAAMWSPSRSDALVVGVRRPGEAWSKPARITRPVEAPSSMLGGYHNMVIDGQGRATVVWGENRTYATTSDHSRAVVRSTTFDITGPRSAMVAPYDGLPTSTVFPVAWNTSDPWQGLVGTDVRYRSAKWNAGFKTRKLWKQNTAAMSAPLRARPGQTYCFSARGHSTVTRFGTNVGPWSPERCITTPVDDRTATANGRWKDVKRTGYYKSTYRQTRHHGDTLTLKNVTARQLDLLVATGPGNGRIKVTFAGNRLGSYRLSSAEDTTKQILRVKRFAKARTGTLKITVTSATGKPVRIDGIYASR